MTTVAAVALVLLVVVGSARLFLHIGGELQRLRDAVDGQAQDAIRQNARLLHAEQEIERWSQHAQGAAANLDGAREDIQQLFDVTHTKRRRRI